MPEGQILQTLADAFIRIGTRGKIEKPLIRCRILHHCFRLSLDRQNERAFVLFELLHEQAGIPPEGGYRMNVFCYVHHALTKS
jgi:hypothetical protein